MWRTRARRAPKGGVSAASFNTIWMTQPLHVLMYSGRDNIALSDQGVCRIYQISASGCQEMQRVHCEYATPVFYFQLFLFGCFLALFLVNSWKK